MNEERLLERIRTWESEPDRRDRGDNIRQVDSILAHLRRILNTRQGGVPISDIYGIPDLNDFLASYPESVTGVEKSIRQAVEKYEPRLQSVNVTFLPQEEDVLCLRFQIIGRIRSGSGRNILIETVVNSDGRISLR